MINSAAEFVELCASKDPRDLYRSLREDLKPEIWMELIFNNASIHADIAQNSTLPPDIMRILARHGDQLTRAILAEKRRIPDDLIAYFSLDQSSLVRKEIAAHSKTSIDILTKLTKDLDEDVAAVAQYALSRKRSLDCQK